MATATHQTTTLRRWRHVGWMAARLGVLLMVVVLGAWIGANHASAQAPQLAITEVWPGGLDGEEATADWIEVTNVGDTPFDAWPTIRMREGLLREGLPDGIALSGGVFSDVGALAPGASAVFLTAYDADSFDAWSPAAPRIFNPANFNEAAAAFGATWGPAVTGIQLGALDASFGGPWEGLSRDGEPLALYLADDGTNFVTGGVTLLDAIDFGPSNRAGYKFAPTPTSDPVLRAGSLATLGVDGAFEGVGPANGGIVPNLFQGLPPIGSPGVVPEPAAAMNFLALLLALPYRRRLIALPHV
ncbi:MAG: hypothetical protein AAGJ38_02285 [Planctomycetota bacterium]